MHKYSFHHIEAFSSAASSVNAYIFMSLAYTHHVLITSLLCQLINEMHTVREKVIKFYLALNAFLHIVQASDLAYLTPLGMHYNQAHPPLNPLYFTRPTSYGDLLSFGPDIRPLWNMIKDDLLL